MNALARQGVQVNRQGGDQGLALAGFHLGDHATVENHAAHQLDVEMALSERAFSSLTHGRESFGQQVVQGFAGFDPGPELGRTRLQVVVAQGLKLRLQRIDLFAETRNTLYVSVVGRSKEPLGQRPQHGNLSREMLQE